MRYVRKFDGILVYGVYENVDGNLVSTLEPSQQATRAYWYIACMAATRLQVTLSTS